MQVWSSVMSRESTLAYEIVKDYTKHMNPKFTNNDRKIKYECFGIKKKTCIITGEYINGKGDHLHSVRGNVSSDCSWGSDTLWNIIPVCGRLNSTYKKVKFLIDGIEPYEKDIGCHILTQEEQDYVEQNYSEPLAPNGPTKLEIYNKIQNWKKYCNNKNVVLHVENIAEIDRIIKNHVNITLTRMTEEIQLILDNYFNK